MISLNGEAVLLYDARQYRKLNEEALFDGYSYYPFGLMLADFSNKLCIAIGSDLLCIGTDGETFWKLSMPSRIVSRPLVDIEQRVYVTCSDGSLYCCGRALEEAAS